MVIFLIGPRGSGKSRVGGLLAHRLGLPLHDTDDIIREKAGSGITEFVEREGWPAFRALETAALAETAECAVKTTGAVISTGGGAVLAVENRECMRRLGLVFYLEAPPEVLARRLSRGDALADRPSLTGADPLREISAVLAEREPLYHETAHFVLRADRRPNEVVRAIFHIIQRQGGPAS